jgi:predicted RNase H-like nuclease (RuvC/YqgF family)
MTIEQRLDQLETEIKESQKRIKELEMRLNKMFLTPTDISDTNTSNIKEVATEVRTLFDAEDLGVSVKGDVSFDATRHDAFGGASDISES